jgi:hypothetical protein
LGFTPPYRFWFRQKAQKSKKEKFLMTPIGIHLKKRQAPLLICVIVLFASLPSFANAATVPPVSRLSSSLNSIAAVPPPDEPDNSLQGNTQLTDTMMITLQTPPYQITAGSDGFDLVQIEGFDRFGSPGDPALPGKIYNIAVPPDVVWESVQVEILRAESVELPGPYEIAPALPPVTWVEGREIVAWGDNAASIVDGKNTKVYQDNAYFPSTYATSIAQSQMRKWRFVRLLFTPIQYNPVTKELRLATEVEVQVAFEREPAIQTQQIQAELSDTAMDDEARQILYNYDQAKGWYQTDNPPIGANAVADYVIITTNAIVAGSSQLNSFVTHKQAKGHTVETVTETQYGGLVGQSPNGTAEKIRKWLKDNYITKQIQYVLLIGNPDPDDPSLGGDSVGDVPMKMCWPLRSEPEYKEAPTDYFYADLTGNWDLDGDQYFGEYNGDRGTGGVDFAAEVYVGRIPVYTGVAGWATTLDNILQKTMDYENSSDLAWRKSALLPMSFSDSSTDGAPLAEYMKSGYLNGAGYTSYAMYQHRTAGCNSSYASNQDLIDAAVRTRWQNNDYGIVTWWGHGSEIGAYIGYGSSCSDGDILTNTDTGVLDDSHPAFVYQCSCLNGYPETSSNLGYALLKQGAIATVSASRVSWYAVGPWTPSRSYADNAAIGYYFVQQIANEERVGKALYEEKEAMGTDWGGSSWMNLMDFNIYGDPSTSIKASGSGCQDAYEPDNAYTGAKWITVNGTAQTHNFDVAGDVDWAKFSVTAGSAYTITTSNLGGSNNTILELYDTNGTTKLRDDDCVGLASCINNWSDPDSGTYFIKVRNASGTGGCTEYGYDLAVVSDSSSKSPGAFLPLIMKSGTCNDTQVVQNSGFESGRTVWMQSQYYIIGTGGGYYPRNGTWSAWFGGYSNANDWLYQTINIPAGVSSARLVFYLYIYSEEYGPDRHDVFHVELQNASGGTLESFLWADNTMSSSGWYKGTAEWDNFSSHAGQTRRLFFQATTNSSLVTNFFVDDVTFWTYCGGLPAGASEAIGPDGWTWEKVEAPPGYTPAPYNGQALEKHKNE